MHSPTTTSMRPSSSDPSTPSPLSTFANRKAMSTTCTSRASEPKDNQSFYQMSSPHDNNAIPSDLALWRNPQDDISTFGKQATHSIAPFLARHIPEQYAPLGKQSFQQTHPDKSNTKFCYRHRPDLKCRRQANEPSMDQLQNGLADLPPADQEGISHVWSLFSAAPSKHRTLMLQGILAQCCFPQLSFISNSVRSLIKIDFLSALPTEIGLRILCFLDPTSICKAAQVSETWRRLSDDDVVWHRMCEQHIDRKCTTCGWGLPLLDRNRLRTEKRQMQLRATGQQPSLHEQSHQVPKDRASSATPSIASMTISEPIIGEKRPAAAPLQALDGSAKKLCSASAKSIDGEASFQARHQPWKEVYKDRFKIGTNWKYGRCSIRTFTGHTNGVMCLQFDDNILATGSYDTTIKIWDIETGKELRTLSGHALGVRCLQFDDSKLFSGSLDGTIKLWDLESGKLLNTLPGHTGGVIGLHFDGTILASGSADRTIRVWNFKDRSSVVLRGHDDWVNAVKIDSASRTLFSASDDCTIKLWDLDTHRCIRTFKGHNGQVQQVVPLPPEFDFADPENPPSPDSVSNVSHSDDRPPPPRHMLTSGLDSVIRLWDVHTGACIRTFFGHLEGVWALAADTLRIVSGANDGLVKIWDPRSGKCERTFSHRAPVTCVGLSDRRMCTGSENHEVRLYSFCT